MYRGVVAVPAPPAALTEWLTNPSGGHPARPQLQSAAVASPALQYNPARISAPTSGFYIFLSLLALMMTVTWVEQEKLV